MKVYTRTGDNGTTGLLGGSRTMKSSARLHACGSLDELNAALGVVLSDGSGPKILRNQIGEIQRLLFTIGADVATPHRSSIEVVRISQGEIQKLEQWIDALSVELPTLRNFILPGGSTCGALLHLARTVCRRTERWIVALSAQEPVNENIVPFMNRLSGYLFVAARFANKEAGREETKVTISKAGVKL